MANCRVPPLWDGESYYFVAREVEREGFEKTELVLWGRRLDLVMPYKATHEEKGRALKEFIDRTKNVYSEEDHEHIVGGHRSASRHWESKWTALLNNVELEKRRAMRDGLREILDWADAFASRRSGKYRQEGAQELVEAMRRSIGVDSDEKG